MRVLAMLIVLRRRLGGMVLHVLCGIVLIVLIVLHLIAPAMIMLRGLGAVIVLRRGRGAVIMRGRRLLLIGLTGLRRLALRGLAVVVGLRHGGRSDGQGGRGDEAGAADHSVPLDAKLSCAALRRSALTMTLTDERAMAAAAIAGDSSRPRAG